MTQYFKFHFFFCQYAALNHLKYNRSVGYIEIDLACNYGASMAGEYIRSLSTIEIASGWWEAEELMGRAQHDTFEALKEIRHRSPFEWVEIDSNNDRMFINSCLLRYCKEEGLEFTRSRPCRKNDNAYIEQKNYTHIQRLLGYLRYDTEEELHMMMEQSSYV